MGRCVKCLMDPCLCHIGGFGEDEEDDTTEKDMQELLGRRCIVKTTLEGDIFFSQALKDFKEVRATDVEGIIDNIQGIISSEAAKAILSGVELENSTEPAARVMYLIKYPKPINYVSAQWYLEEEVIYL